MKKITISLVVGASLVALVLALLAAGPAGALAPCTVEEDGSGTHATIQAAVDDPVCDPIHIGAGIFVENVSIDRSLTIQGQGPAQTIVDGNLAGRIFTIHTSRDVILTGLTIQNGSQTYGGGIRNDGTLTVTHSTLSSNAAGFFGGAIYNDGYNNGTLTVISSTLSGNSGGDGGGIYNGGTLTVISSTLSNNSANIGAGIRNNGTMTVTHSTLSNNSASNFFGGGIYNFNLSTLTLISSTVSGNSSYAEGGGIYNRGTLTVSGSNINGNASGGIRNDGTLAVRGSTLSDNSGQGGILNRGTLTVTQSTLSGNTAGVAGGGIYNYVGTLTVISSTLSGNAAVDGGGFYNGGMLTMTQSTVSANAASTGGGIYNNGTVIVTNSTLGGNSSSDGGGIWNSGTLTVTGSIIANSVGGGDCMGPLTSLGYNIDSDGSCNLTGPGDQPNTNPLLGPLQDNGGPTWTYALLPSSPAIDAGDNTSCPATDQRGIPRPQDGDGDGTATCDIGAYEVEAPLVISKSGPPIVELYGSVTYSLTVANNLTSTLADVVITDTMPSGAVYISGGTLVGNVVSWTVPSLAPSTMITRQFVVSATTTLTNSDYRATAGGYVAVGYEPIVTVVQVPVLGLDAANSSPTALGQATTLTATVTAGTDVTYDWDFGDGTYGTGQLVAHTYADPGMYTAVVTASNAVSSAVADTVVTIAESVTGLMAVNDSPTALGKATTLTATVTTGTDVTYDWDFGDETTGKGATVTRTYTDPGVYTAVVTASNAVSSVTTTTAVVVEEAIAGLGAVSEAPTSIGQTTTFSVTLTAGTNVSFTWDFGDTYTAAGQLVTHTYAAVGEYSVTVTAVNLVSSEMVTITVYVTPAEIHLPVVMRP